MPLVIPRVRDVMREVPITVSEGDLLVEVIRIMASRGIGSVIVTDELGDVVGVFTERDLLRLLANSTNIGELTVGDVMTREVISVEPGASLIKAIHIMAKHGIRHLPVLDRDGKLMGIVSIRDAAIALARILVDANISGVELTSEEVEMIMDIDEGRGY